MIEQFVDFFVPHFLTYRFFTLYTMSSLWFNHFTANAFMRLAKGCTKTESAGYVYLHWVPMYLVPLQPYLPGWHEWRKQLILLFQFDLPSGSRAECWANWNWSQSFFSFHPVFFYHLFWTGLLVLMLKEISLDRGHDWAVCWLLRTSFFDLSLFYTLHHVFPLIQPFHRKCIHEVGKGLHQDGVRRLCVLALGPNVPSPSTALFARLARMEKAIDPTFPVWLAKRKSSWVLS